jgi:hypothetical protein
LCGKYSQGCDGRQLDGGYLPYRDCAADRKFDDSAQMPEAHIIFFCMPMFIMSVGTQAGDSDLFIC